ncbi:hypothetical protein LCGC14_0951590 [marine sediment metagenome]|uniref:Uncharacterized protein n=1 Tax=marine sediment metagenome TaxID=412755 RepID=A0A0F9NH65_9ZZZZ
MAEKKKIKTNGSMKKGVAYWQTDWVKRVLSNGHNPQAKLLFMRIASFGEKGCWMKNETLGEDFNRSDRTIRRAITSLWQKGDIIVTGWNGHGRTLYAAGHPMVLDKLMELYESAKQKGKVKDLSEYREKSRYRSKIKVSSNLGPKKKEIMPDHVVKGINHYRTKP